MCAVVANDPAMPVALPQPSLIDRIRWIFRSWKHRLTDRFKESNLERHARREMELAGLYDSDADYGGGAIAGEVMKLCKVLGRGGHSGGSHGYVMAVFREVANFRRLTPLTTDPDEWMDVSEYSGPKGQPVYQNRRQSSCFSNQRDFSSYYDIDEPGRPLHTTLTPAQARNVRDGKDPGPA